MFRFLRLLAMIWLALAVTPALAAPRADLWERWAAHDPQSSLEIDHSTWDGLLARYRSTGPDGIARFNYAGVSAEDAQALASYLDSLQQAPVSRLARPQQLAFWLNAYNALTVLTVLRHYPVRSIRDIDISPGLFADGPWGKKLLTMEGQAISLDDIEHRILRPIWQSPLIHYGVNCASLGCPDLPARAFAGQTAITQLEAAAGAFINHPRGVAVTQEGLVLSSIYSWFQADFGGDERAVIAHLAGFADAALAAQLLGISAVSDYVYDWSLNDAAPRKGFGANRPF